MIYPPFCLHPKANILHVLSLDYIVALYPFMLILMTYVLVTMYDKHYRILVWMWKPFKRCMLAILSKIFATFVKIFVVCLDPIESYDINGNSLLRTL